MTSAVLTQLPWSAGQAIASSFGRAALWGMSRYARAPLANTAILGLAAFSLLASTNALYFQTHRHPSPLFGTPSQQAVEVEPVIPAPPRPKAKPQAVQTTGSVAVKPAVSQTIGNAEVQALQQRLQQIGLFDGTVDGLYGPRTARAIRKFEHQQGLKPSGQLTPQILEAILSMAALPPQPAVQTTATPQLQPEPPVSVTANLAAPQAQAEPVAVQPPPKVETAAVPDATPMPAIQALPAPAPLEPSIEVASSGKPPSATRPRSIASNDDGPPATDVAENVAEVPAALRAGDIQLAPLAQPAARPQPAAAPDAGTPAPPTTLPQTEATSPVEADPTAVAPAGSVADIVTGEMPTVATEPVDNGQSRSPALIAKVQRGLASLGFLSGKIDGVPGEATAKAIRNFEVWNNYDVTGRVTPELLKLLVAAGAEI